jgi:signal transduction histidine kinase
MQETDVLEAERLLEPVMHGSIDPISVKDASGRYLLANHSMAEAVQVAGTAELIGRRDADLMPLAEAQAVQSSDEIVMQTRAPMVVEEAYGGATFICRKSPWRDALGRVIGVIGVSRRLGDDREAHFQAQESLALARRKLAAMGVFVSSIVHDFNNLLSTIMGSVETLQRRGNVTEPRLVRRMDLALRAAERASALTQRLLAFSRRKRPDPMPTDLNGLVRAILGGLNRALGDEIMIQIELAEGARRVAVDANQIEIAVLNLAANARDAMPDGGTFRITTSDLDLDGAAAAAIDVAPGSYVLLEISDTGTGMTEDVARNAGEPYFTTKAPGDGTGLGLAQVFGMIRQAKGNIAVASEPGHGTTLTLYLPAA